MALKDYLKKKIGQANQLAQGGTFGANAAIGSNLVNKVIGQVKRTLPNGGGEYTAPGIQTKPTPEQMQNMQGAFGTNINTSAPGGFNYATQEIADRANQPTDYNPDSNIETVPEDNGPVSSSELLYAMGEVNNSLSGQSPMDLYTLRSRLARQKALADVGQLPADADIGYNGAGVTTGTPNYNYEDTMAVNKATGDIFDPQIEAIDSYIKSTEKKSESGLSGSTLTKVRCI